MASGTAEATSKSVYVISHVDVAPDPNIAGLLTALASASRLEDGNVRFDVLLHTMRSNHFEVIETWQSQKALDNHAAAAHTKKYRDDLQASLGSPLDERIYKVIARADDIRMSAPVLGFALGVLSFVLLSSDRIEDGE